MQKGQHAFGRTGETAAERSISPCERAVNEVKRRKARRRCWAVPCSWDVCSLRTPRPTIRKVGPLSAWWMMNCGFQPSPERIESPAGFAAKIISVGKTIGTCLDEDRKGGFLGIMLHRDACLPGPLEHKMSGTKGVREIIGKLVRVGILPCESKPIHQRPQPLRGKNSAGSQWGVRRGPQPPMKRGHAGQTVTVASSPTLPY